MAEQLATPAPHFPNPGFYLRFKPAELRKWVRRNLFTTGYTPMFRFEEASAFASVEEATDFAKLYKLEREVEVLEMRAEAVHAP